MRTRKILLLTLFSLLASTLAYAQTTDQQLARLLKRFPEADANGDGQLSLQEANAYRQQVRDSQVTTDAKAGAPREFEVDSGWAENRFPDSAVCYQSPEKIASIYGSVVSHPKSTDGSLRIVATGHSFMAPGFKTLPPISAAGGFKQQSMLTHTGGGITGSARYKWEQENGIFQFAGKPEPKLLASIANAEWDVMLWGPYFDDRPAYYTCWMDFCLKYNPDMKFYMSDAWPQLYQLEKNPSSEKELTADRIAQMGREKHAIYADIIATLNQAHPGKVYILPTCDAMVLAAAAFHRGELPGVEGIHAVIGKKERSLWRDQLGHLGPGFDRLEGYVFYSTLYGRSPELIEGDVPFADPPEFPGKELDRAFRKIAWKAVTGNPLSGVTDADGDGVSDLNNR